MVHTHRHSDEGKESGNRLIGDVVAEYLRLAALLLGIGYAIRQTFPSR